MPRAALSLPVLLMTLATSHAVDIGYVEDFALAADRDGVLKQLVPGTEDFYYYHALHYLNTEQFEKAEAITQPWVERHGTTQRLKEIRTRHALLTYARNPEKSLQYLRQNLGVQYNHLRIVPGGVPDLPTVLDNALLSRVTLAKASQERWGLLENFEDSALDWLAAENLTPDRRRNLLQRVSRPDLPNLVKLLVADLAHPNAAGFGGRPVDFKLTLAQLDELVAAKPDLRNVPAFADLYLKKLQPGADADWRNDRTVLAAVLDRQLAFARTLNASHNSLKAHLLFHRLTLGRALGQYDKKLFLEYLALPRQQGYMPRKLNELPDSQRFPANLGVNFAGATLLPPVGSDEPLVRAYLKHFLADAESPREFAELIDADYLKALFAETKIELGLGEAEKWASDLSPEAFRALKDRVDIDFAATNKPQFAADEPVKLDLQIKNVPTLIVKVFEINAANYYKSRGKEIDTDAALDGLVPNAERTATYAEAPVRRVGRTFEFPELTKPGVYVIDFIGAGKSSRALIRKGRLRPLVTPSTAGVRVTVVDDANRLVPNAVVWLGGKDYAAEKDGTVLLPFSGAPGLRPVVLQGNGFASFDNVFHPGEAYALTAGFHIDRESLLTQRMAQIVVRPGLTLNGEPVSVKLLEKPKLTLVATDLDGVRTTTEVPDARLFEDRDTVHEFRVPARLQLLDVTLTGTVKSLTTAQDVPVAASKVFALNTVRATDRIADVHLAKFGADYAVEVLGRSGEPLADRAVNFQVKHRDFKEPVYATLKSDARGRVTLGVLTDVQWVRADLAGHVRTWQLPLDRTAYATLLHAKAGDAVTLPFDGPTAARADVALFAMKGDVILADRFDVVKLAAGQLELTGLAAGDYDLYLKRTGEKIRVRVADGPAVAGFVLGKVQQLQLPPLKPVRVAELSADDKTVTVKLGDASKFARVHVFAHRYLGGYDAFENLNDVADAGLRAFYPGHSAAAYLTGRDIGDEYRYVLDRKYARKYPGNMLAKPELLLHPWAVRETLTGEQQAQAGGAFGAVGAPVPGKMDDMQRRKSGSGRGEGGSGSGIGDGGTGSDRSTYPDLDFLADAAAVLTNLVPDADGTVRIPREKLGPHAVVTVAVVDPLHTTVRTLTLPEQQAARLDLRLKDGLDPKGHFTQRKQVTVLPPNAPFVLADAAGGRFDAYDSVARAYGLYATLVKDPRLAEFAFVTTWNTLKLDRKQSQYAKFACHELNFFLAKKDPEFFAAHVKPVLANKKDKTFFDHYLLGADLSSYLAPWAYGRLNAVESALLAKTLAGEKDRATRLFADLLKLIPPDLAGEQFLFDTGVLGKAMDYEETLAFGRRTFQPSEPMAAGVPGVFGNGLGVGGGINGGFGGGGGGFGGNLGGVGGGPAGPTGAPAPAAKPMPRMEQKEAAKDAAPDDAKKRDGAAKSESALEYREKLRAINGVDKDGKDYFFEAERLNKQLAAPLYRNVDVTKEWAENNYYHRPIAEQVAELVLVSEFWKDYAAHDDKTPFLSKHFATAGRNFTEAVLALAVLDLPFEAKKPDVKFDAGKMTYTPAGPAVAFHEEVRPTAAPGGNLPVLVSQNFFAADDRYKDENGERLDKYVTGEFVTHRAYGCQVVVTNPSPSRQRLTVLIQVPVGAIALSNAKPTRSVLLDLEPYRTATLDTFFYFPKPGTFAHFPVHVAKNETPVAAAPATTFTVVEKPTKFDTESWDYVSQNGTSEQVLAFLAKDNVHGLDLSKIAYRLKDNAFFGATVKLLQDRHRYDPTVWSYGLLHNDAAAAREYLKHAANLLAEADGPLTTPLLTIDPVAEHRYEHLEYKPLVNARAHALGNRRQIVNDRLHEQYHRFLKVLTYRKAPTADDRLALAYYLLLQDRVDEAAAHFAKVDAAAVATKVQYDYLAAYLALYDDPAKANAIALQYVNYPNDRWKKLFAGVTAVIAEAAGQAAAAANPKDDAAAKQAAAAAAEPAFEVTLTGTTVGVAYTNVPAVRVNYYLMDVELLFSRSPFVATTGGQFAVIKPNATAEVALPEGGKHTFELPAELRKKNVLVEVTAAGKTRAAAYYASAMDVTVNESYGQVTVAAAGKALPKVYVKCYVRLADGRVKFHKDGYTDLRGKFDYATVSTPEGGGGPQKFAVLVLSEDAGATIREANPPQK